MENDGYLLESQREVENTFERRILVYSYPFQAFVYCTPHYWRIAKSLCLNYCCAKKLTTSYMNPFIMAAVLSPEVSSLCLNLNQHNFHLVVLNPTFGTAENRSIRNQLEKEQKWNQGQTESLSLTLNISWNHWQGNKMGNIMKPWSFLPSKRRLGNSSLKGKLIHSKQNLS